MKRKILHNSPSGQAYSITWELSDDATTINLTANDPITKSKLTLKDVGEPAKKNIVSPNKAKPLLGDILEIPEQQIFDNIPADWIIDFSNCKSAKLYSTDITGWQKLRSFLNKRKPKPIFSKGGLI